MKFEQNKKGCIEARKWLRENNLLEHCGPSDCDGITFIICANELFKQNITSPYMIFSEVFCKISDMKKALDEDYAVSKDDLDILEESIGNLVASFTDLLVEDCECF